MGDNAVLIDPPRGPQGNSWKDYIVGVIAPGLCAILVAVIGWSVTATMRDVKSELQQFRSLMTTIQISSARDGQRLASVEADMGRLEDKVERMLDREEAR